MTRFQREISGELGDYWKTSAEKDVEHAVKKATDEAVVEEDGAIRWKMGNYLMDDMCEMLEYAGFLFSRKATKVKRDKQNHKFAVEYAERMRNYVYSDEEISEMRAAFGPGTVVVDIITGKEFNI